MEDDGGSFYCTFAQKNPPLIAWSHRNRRDVGRDKPEYHVLSGDPGAFSGAP